MKTFSSILVIVALVSNTQGLEVERPVIPFHPERMENAHFQRHVLEGPVQFETPDKEKELVQTQAENVPEEHMNIELDMATEQEVKFAMDQYKSTHTFF